MPDEPQVFFRTRDGGVLARVVRNPHPYIEVSEDVLHQRDGNKSPAQGDPMQICVDSRGRHRSVPSRDERGTYKLSDHEVVSVQEYRSPNGERRKRYTLRRTEAT